MARAAFLLASLICLLLLWTGPASAQVTLLQSGETSEPAELPEPLTEEAVREMVARLSDNEVRALLLSRLDAVARAETEQATDAGLIEFAQKATTGVYESVAGAVALVPLIWDSQIRSLAGFRDRVGERGLWILAAIMAGGIAVGLIAEKLFHILTRKWHATAIAPGEDSLWTSMKFLFNRFCSDILGVLVFFLVARLAGIALAERVFGGFSEIGGLAPYAELFWTNLIVLPRLAAALSRFVLAPHRTEFRIVHTDDWTARYLHRNQIGLVLLIGFTIFIFAFNDMNGVPMGESRLGFWLNLGIHIYIGLIAWTARDGLVTMMRGADPDVTEIEERIARAYPWFVIAVSAGTWYMVEIIVAYGAFELLANIPHVWMMILLIMAPAMDTLIRGLVRHLAPRMTGEGRIAEQAYQSTKRSYIRIGRVIAFAVVLLLIGKIWGLEYRSLAAAGVGAQFAGRLLEMLMVAVAGYLVWEFVSLLINRRLAEEQTAAGLDLSEEEPGGGEGGGAGGSRLSTVLPLLLVVLKVAIATIFGLIALGSLGIDITPLLAGAGIVGLAIGFGAQKLVTDVVSGIFFLVDDAFRVGEYIETEGTVGTVEKISIRSMQLRHHKGPVHTIPYGEIPKLTNYSRDWVIMKLKFTVPFETDPNRVKKIFKKIGNDMMQVPEFAADLLQPFKSQGVFDFDDVGMVIRGKFMAKPGRQFVLRKEIYNRVKSEFEAAGIPFARREVRVAIPGLEDAGSLSEDDKAAIAAAAADAVQSQEGETPGSGGSGPGS